MKPNFTQHFYLRLKDPFPHSMNRLSIHKTTHRSIYKRIPHYFLNFFRNILITFAYWRIWIDNDLLTAYIYSLFSIIRLRMKKFTRSFQFKIVDSALNEIEIHRSNRNASALYCDQTASALYVFHSAFLAAFSGFESNVNLKRLESYFVDIIGKHSKI